MSDDIVFDVEKSVELKKKLMGQPYLWKDVWYCMFNNADTFPESISIMCRIKCADFDAGVVYCTNVESRKYKEIYLEGEKLLNKAFFATKRNILSRSKLSIGWEGVMLNESRYS